MTATYKVALIGFGNIAEHAHCGALLNSDAFNLVAIYDPVETRLAAAQKLIPECRVYSEFDPIFARHSPDLFVICSPPAFHYDAIMKALAANCHVVCEKPLLTDIQQYKIVRECARLSHRLVYPCHNYKFAAPLRKAKEILDSGEIGTIRRISIATIRPTHARGCTDWKPDWRRHKAISGGGIVWDHAVHSIYLTTWWLNRAPTDVASVIATCDDRFDTEDVALITLQYGETVCQIFVTWNGRSRAFECLIEGDEGSIVISPESLAVRRKDGFHLEEEGTSQSGFDSSDHSAWYRLMYQDALVHLRAEDFDEAVFNEAFLAAAVVERVYAALRSDPIVTRHPLRDGLLAPDLRRHYERTT